MIKQAWSDDFWYIFINFLDFYCFLDHDTYNHQKSSKIIIYRAISVWSGNSTQLPPSRCRRSQADSICASPHPSRDPWGSGTPQYCKFHASCTGTRRRSGRALTGTRACGRHNLLIAPKSIFTFYISFEHFLYVSIFLHFLRTDFNLIWNDTTHVQILFINWLRVVVWCCSFLCLFVCLFAKYALRVPPAVTRLTVYRRLRVIPGWSRDLQDIIKQL